MRMLPITAAIVLAATVGSVADAQNPSPPKLAPHSVQTGVTDKTIDGAGAGSNAAPRNRIGGTTTGADGSTNQWPLLLHATTKHCSIGSKCPLGSTKNNSPSHP
jgi:hypothetical protein